MKANSAFVLNNTGGKNKIFVELQIVRTMSTALTVHAVEIIYIYKCKCEILSLIYPYTRQLFL